MTKINTIGTMLLLLLLQACGSTGEGDMNSNTDLAAQNSQVAPVIRQQNAVGCPVSQQETYNGTVQCKK